MPRVAVLCGLAALLVISACGDRRLAPCTEAYQAGRYEEAVRLCEEAHGSSRDPRAGAVAARALSQLGRGDQALAWVERLRGTSAEPGLWSVAAFVHLGRGEHERATQAYRRDLALLRKAGDRAGAANAHYGLFYVAWERSRYREALEQARLAFTEAGAAENRELQARAAEALFSVLFALGDLEGARRTLDLALRQLPEEKTFERASLLADQGALALEEGRPELARHALAQALELAGERGDDGFRRAHQLNLAQAHLDRGDLGSAERHLAEAGSFSEGETPEVSILYLSARVAHARGRSPEAERLLQQALAGDPVAGWAWELENELGRVAEARGTCGRRSWRTGGRRSPSKSCAAPSASTSSRPGFWSAGASPSNPCSSSRSAPAGWKRRWRRWSGRSPGRSRMPLSMRPLRVRAPRLRPPAGKRRPRGRTRCAACCRR